MTLAQRIAYVLIPALSLTGIALTQPGCCTAAGIAKGAAYGIVEDTKNAYNFFKKFTFSEEKKAEEQKQQYAPQQNKQEETAQAYELQPVFSE